MAQLRIHGNWKSIAALACLVTMFGLLAYSVVARESLGAWLYIFSLGAIVFGFWSKEDHVAVSGIAGIFLVLTLDIILRIGFLGFTECKPHWSALFGCP